MFLAVCTPDTHVARMGQLNACEILFVKMT